MTQRGRPSAASFEVAPVLALPVRPPAPPELSAEQAREWVATVDRLSPTWFPRETHPLLAQLCRSVVSAREIDRRIIRAKGASVKELNLLLMMRDRERRAIESLSRTMRLTQRSRYSKEKKTGPTGPRPWE